MKSIFTYSISFIVLFLASSCASYKTQYAKEESNWQSKIDTSKEIKYSIYLIGDAGKLHADGVNYVTQKVGEKLKTESKNSALIYLGDNIYNNGLPKKEAEKRKEAEKILEAQLSILTHFKGKPIIIPGNHDWNKGLKSLERQEKYVEKFLDNKDVFFPENGCPIEKVKLTKDIILITINSQWYLQNWDKTPGINSNCAIKTRLQFFEELESLIKNNEGKTTLIAMHHPVYSNGSHGGHYAFKQHLKPFPVLGSLITILRKMTGVSPQDLQNKRYKEYRNRLVALAQQNSKIVLLSGHEHSLQYINKNNVPQIISGAGAKFTAVKNKDGAFSYSNLGYAKLLIYKDGAVGVQFFGVSKDRDTLVFQKEIFPALKE